MEEPFIIKADCLFLKQEIGQRLELLIPPHPFWNKV